MTTSHETMTDAARRGQEAFTGPRQAWADSVQWYAPTSDARLHGAGEFVDKMFDFYHHVLAWQWGYYYRVLACQREYTKGWLAVTTSAATTSAAPKEGSAPQAAAKDAASKRS